MPSKRKGNESYPKSKLIVVVTEIAKPEASAATICEVPGLSGSSIDDQDR